MGAVTVPTAQVAPSPVAEQRSKRGFRVWPFHKTAKMALGRTIASDGSSVTPLVPYVAEHASPHVAHTPPFDTSISPPVYRARLDPDHGWPVGVAGKLSEAFR